MKRAGAVWLAVLAAGGCTRLTVPTFPAPVPRPTIEIEPIVLHEEPPPIGPPEFTEPLDEILDSPLLGWPGFDDEVARWERYWTEPERDWFPVFLERMSAYEAIVDAAIERYDVPASLRYLPIVESGYATGAVSRSAAVGLWQLMSGTARSSGMRVGSMVDERRDPVLATDAALRYLKELHDRFDSWFLALAAYNGGPSRVQRLLREHLPGAPSSDSLYFKVWRYLPGETRAFVPRFVAAAKLAHSPEEYGIEGYDRRPLFVFDEVSVPDATTLDVVAQAAGVTEAEVVALNPHVLRGMTSRGVPTTLRVPRGAGWRFNYEYPKIPVTERVTVTEHVVESGDTLWDIARKYGVRLDVLEDANPTVRPERLRLGYRLLVPMVPRSGSPF